MNTKKYLLLLVLVISASQAKAQQLQNPSFDSVYYGGIDRLWNWITSDATFMGGSTSNDTVGPQQANMFFGMGQGHEIFGNIDVYNSSPYSTVAVKLNTTFYKKNNGAPFETYIVNGEHYYTGQDGYIDFSKCGVPFTYRPDSLQGVYQYIDSNATTTDYGICIILLKKYNSSLGKIDTIAYVEDSLSFAASNWKTFSLPINYLSAAQPDSLVVIFKASTRPFEGSSFWLDSLSFMYNTPNASSSLVLNKTLPIVYPNPASNVLFIKQAKWALTKYRLLNLEGKTLEKAPFKSSISISEQPSGVLFLELYDHDGLVKTYKINKND